MKTLVIQASSILLVCLLSFGCDIYALSGPPEDPTDTSIDDTNNGATDAPDTPNPGDTTPDTTPDTVDDPKDGVTDEPDVPAVDPCEKLYFLDGEWKSVTTGEPMDVSCEPQGAVCAVMFTGPGTFVALDHDYTGTDLPLTDTVGKFYTETDFDGTHLVQRRRNNVTNPDGELSESLFIR